MVRKPRSGELFYSVTFEEKTGSSDGYGGTTSSWSEQFTCRAAFVYLRGGEAIQAARLEGKEPRIIRTRKTTNSDLVNTDWRVKDARSGEYFNIRNIQPSLDRQYVDFLCEKGVAT